MKMSEEDSFMHSDPLIGVVTVTFNSGLVIRGFMDSLLKQTYADFILYVVDNASSDATLHYLAEYNDLRIVVIRNSTNVGAAEGNNIGIRAAAKDGCTSILLINNDTEFDGDLIEHLCDGLRRHESDMVIPKIAYFDEPDKVWSAGGYFSGLRGTSRHFGMNRKDDGQFDQARAVEYGPTTCMLIRREVFGRVGLLDADYFAYLEDTDFCYRARQAKVKLFYVPSAHLLHRVSSLTGRDSDFITRYSIRNHVYHVFKNLPGWQRLFYLPALQIHLITKFILLRRNVGTFWLAEKAFWEGISLGNSRGTNGGKLPSKLESIS
jgi:GT2 family glycosyltransferase